jgi:hypothetical protein
MAPVTIPARPCKPDQIPAYVGLDFKPDLTTTLFAAWTADNKAAGFTTFYMNGSIQDVSTSYRVGYQLVTADTAGSTVAKTGHVYGLLGQGDAMVAATTKAFQWKAPEATKKHYMMVSILPYLDTMTALGSSDKITISWSIAAFDTDVNSFSKPTQPAAAVDPVAAIGASALVASAVAIVSVAVSLF